MARGFFTNPEINCTDLQSLMMCRCPVGYSSNNLRKMDPSVYPNHTKPMDCYECVRKNNPVGVLFYIKRKTLEFIFWIRSTVSKLSGLRHPVTSDKKPSKFPVPFEDIKSPFILGISLGMRVFFRAIS